MCVTGVDLEVWNLFLKRKESYQHFPGTLDMDPTPALSHPLSCDVLHSLRRLHPSSQSEEQTKDGEEKHRGRLARGSLQPALLHRQDPKVGVVDLLGGAGQHELQLRHLVEKHLLGSGKRSP